MILLALLGCLDELLESPYVLAPGIGEARSVSARVDGRLLVATNTGQAIAPHLIKLGYDPLKQLQPVGLIVVVPNVLVVGDKVAAKDVKELVAMAKAKPGELKYASSGVGSTQHIAGEAFDLAAGVKTTHIPYKGSSQAHVDILGGNVEICSGTGRTVARTRSTRLCRCGASGNKPFCDGSHARIGFRSEQPF